MKDLSEHQKRVLKDILSYRKRHGYSPAPSYLAEPYDITRQAVEDVVKVLIKKGYLKKIERYKQGWFEPVDK